MIIEKAKKILEAYGNPGFKKGNTFVTFSRQTEEDIKQIENKTDKDLVGEWKSLVYLNEVLGQVSLNDLQRINLIELEIESRDTINSLELKGWLENELDKFEE